MLKRLLLFSAVLMLPLICRADKETMVDSVAAYVNAYTITVSDVIKSSPALQQLLSQGSSDKNKINELFEEALNNLIDRKLILGAYEKQSKFKIPDEAFTERENAIINDAFKGSREDFMDALAAENISVDQWRANLREKSIVQAMRSLNVDQKVALSPLAAYERYQLESDKYTTSPSVKIRMMVIAKGDTPAAKEKQKKVMITVLKAIKAGEDFGELARKYSEDSYASKGGERGWMKKDMLREDIAKAAFLSDAGAIQVVDLGKQYCILKIEDKVDAERVPYEEAKPLIEQELRHEIAQKIYNSWIERLRREAYVKVAANALY